MISKSTYVMCFLISDIICHDIVMGDELDLKVRGCNPTQSRFVILDNGRGGGVGGSIDDALRRRAISDSTNMEGNNRVRVSILPFEALSRLSDWASLMSVLYT